MRAAETSLIFVSILEARTLRPIPSPLNDDANMTLFHVSPDCLDLGLRAGAILFRNVQTGDAPNGLVEIMRLRIRGILDAYPSPAAMRATPEIKAFQRILRDVGVNPSKHSPSVQRLHQFVLKRGGLPQINALVDAYNLVSLESRCSMGAHDLDQITAPVSLRLLRGDESFIPLGQVKAEAVRPGEFGYVDAANRLMCRLDLMQAEFSKVTPATRNVLMIVEATAAHKPELARQAMANVMTLAKEFCHAESEVLHWPFTDPDGS